MQITIPHHFTARDYQIPFLRAVEKSINGQSDIRYFMQIWARRTGKDKTNIADVVPRRLIQSPALVKYVYPTLVMGRDNLWQGMGSDGFKYINHIPSRIIQGKLNKTRMTLDTVNGSMFQVAGSDSPDTLRGGNAKLYVFSEWSEQDPYAWDVVEPILRENDGIAIFNMTPKGDNHARALYDYAKNDPKWYTEIITAHDANIFTPEKIEEIRQNIIKRFSANGRSEEEANSYFEQEYLCSFESPMIGSYYGAAIRKAEAEGRITKVQYTESLPVSTWWDLGMSDSTAIWFTQRRGLDIAVIDYYESSGEGLGHYIKVLKEKGYIYDTHNAPHDIEVRELGTGKSRMETARGLGVQFRMVPKLSVQDGIEAVRMILGRCWFDKDKCFRGLQALKGYRKDRDEKNKIDRSYPKHDWTSHSADAFRYMAVGFQEKVNKPMSIYKKFRSIYER